MDIEYIQNLTQKIDLLLNSYQKICQELVRLKEELAEKNALILKLQEEIELLNKERHTVKEKISDIISKIDQVENVMDSSLKDETGRQEQELGTSSLEGF